MNAASAEVDQDRSLLGGELLGKPGQVAVAIPIGGSPPIENRVGSTCDLKRGVQAVRKWSHSVLHRGVVPGSTRHPWATHPSGSPCAGAWGEATVRKRYALVSQVG